jgi:hypothetical protein
MCFFCCYFCCPDDHDDHDEFVSEQRAYRQKCDLPRNADKKVITFIEQVRTKGVTVYGKCAYQYNKTHSKSPLLRDQFGKPMCANKKYLACPQRSRSLVSLSDVSERSEESLTESLSSSLEINGNENPSLTYSRSGSFTCSINGDDVNQKRANSSDSGRIKSNGYKKMWKIFACELLRILAVLIFNLIQGSAKCLLVHCYVK